MSETKKFTFNEIESTPEEPGLYAWYLEIVFGKADTSAPDDWVVRLTEYVEQHKRPDLQIKAEAALGLKFSGRLKHDVLEMKSEWQTVSADVIENVSDILARAVPIAASPLYMGIATKNLRNRLMSHKQLIKSIRDTGSVEAGSYASDINEEQQKADRTFAERVVKRSIDVNTLAVHIMPLPQKDNTPEAKKVLEMAEYILNRLYYPILGRR
jgi:hypothetical protein